MLMVQLVLSGHEQVCLMKLHFEKYLYYHQEMEMIMSHIFKKNMWTLTETTKIVDVGERKLCNAN